MNPQQRSNHRSVMAKNFKPYVNARSCLTKLSEIVSVLAWIRPSQIIQGLFNKTKENVYRLLALCMAAPPPIVFFGSIASNLQTFTSDVDAKVLSDDPDLPQFLYTVLAGTVATDARLIAGDRVYYLRLRVL